MKIKYILSDDKRTNEINKLIQTKFKSFLDESNPDIILVAGGDGALLHAIQQYNHLQIPFLGLACGSLNFLMNRIDDLKDFLNQLIKDQTNLQTLKTTSIKVELKKKNYNELIGYAINEVVVGTNIMGYHSLSLSSSDFMFDDFKIKGSGVCIATDLGSTAYNFNLGGPVLPLGRNLWSVRGVVCDRFLEDIVPIQKLETENISDRSVVSIYIDGIETKFKLEKGNKLVLNKGEVIKIAFLNKEEFIKRRMEIASRYRK
ncbi:MAG: NAD(+)/NADH kinase [Candidatus Shapirobacteria bacterium]|nr:NAD(+)/NADH kinase [Candidatus Shapirobacteria bacterium]